MSRAKNILNHFNISEEEKFNTARLTNLANSLNALTDLLKIMGENNLSAKVGKSASAIESLLKNSYQASKDQVYQVFKDADFNNMLDEIKDAFKSYEGRGMKVKFGRKDVNLPDAIRNFITVFQVAVKDLRSQGFDSNAVK